MKSLKNKARWFAIFVELVYSSKLFGGIAQLGERLHGMQEVSGSIPLTSTKEFSPYRLEA